MEIKNIQFSYNLNNVWDFEVMSNGNSWMDIGIENEIARRLESSSFYTIANDHSMWNKISIDLFDTPVLLIEDKGIVFFPPTISPNTEADGKRIKRIGEVIKSFKKKDLPFSVFPSNTIINIEKKEIKGLELSPSLFPSKSNILYNAIALLLILNVAK